MNKNISLICFLILISSNLYSQLQDRIWIFGRPTSGSTNATLYFGNLSNPVTALPSGQPNQITSTNGWEEWAVVTNPYTGNLIFYTDGQNVFDNQHNLIDLDTTVAGFESLGASKSSSQPVALSVIPRLEKSSYTNYYIFSNPTGAIGSSIGIGPITYRIYNVASQSFSASMNLPGSYGTTSVSEGMKIIPCDNNLNKLWLITSLFPYSGNERRYVVYEILDNTITYNGVFDMGPNKAIISVGASPLINIVYTKANANYGITNVGFSLQSTSSVFTCQFDNINGQFLTNTTKTYNTGFGELPAVYDLEFSPNGRFLYYTVYNSSASNDLYQIDMQDAVYNPVLVHNYPYRYSGGLGIGPDSLIYHIYDSGYDSQVLRLGRILQPDVKYIPGTTDYSQFYEGNFQTYNNTWGINFCEFLTLPRIITGIPSEEQNSSTIDIFPNPIKDILTIDAPQINGEYTISISTINGQEVLKQKINENSGKSEINISNLSSGVYIIKAKTDKGIMVKKFIKQ
jgi:hypothetical protein